ncbi:hypothetical protein R3P38DRAFT_3495681 [Favolaschia claudopus]|uniref:Uncharacterized protein n=1 Tax=Favolaschia claudopus TaxID=2862362 RepID=A0AAV9Z5X5_9AGAR
MSLLVNGTLAARVARTEEPATRISASFVQMHFPPSQHSSTHLPCVLTLQTTERDPLSVLLSCDVSADLDFDVVLGLNWKAYSRELLLRSGYSVPVNFDPWTLVPSAPLLCSPTSTALQEPRDALSSHSPVLNETVVDPHDKSVKCLSSSVSVPGCSRAPVISANISRNYDPSLLPEPSSSNGLNSVTPHRPGLLSDGRDLLNALLLSPDGALLTHLFSGACSTLSQTAPSLSGCRSVFDGFDGAMDLAHYCLSILISGLHNSRYTLSTIASVLGSELPDTSDLETVFGAAHSRLVAKRSGLIAEFSEHHPTQDVLQRLDRLPHASLISLAALHGIPSQDCALQTLRNVITTHLVSGACAPAV